jgi:hypothetical protein
MEKMWLNSQEPESSNQTKPNIFIFQPAPDTIMMYQMGNKPKN